MVQRQKYLYKLLNSYKKLSIRHIFIFHQVKNLAGPGSTIK